MVAELTGDHRADDCADITDGEEIADVAHAERKRLRDQWRSKGRHDGVVSVDHRDNEAENGDETRPDFDGSALSDHPDLIYLCHDNSSRFYAHTCHAIT